MRQTHRRRHRPTSSGSRARPAGGISPEAAGRAEPRGEGAPSRREGDPNPRRFSGRLAERGAVLVETALVLPLVLILFMGIIDFGTAIADINSLRQGDREAVRRAVVGDVSGASACSIAGTAPTADTAALVCLTKDMTGLDPATTQVAILFDSSYVEGDALILCAQYPLRSISGFFGTLLDGKIVHSQVDMRIERPTLDIQAFQESGAGDWAWCG